MANGRKHNADGVGFVMRNTAVESRTVEKAEKMWNLSRGTTNTEDTCSKFRGFVNTFGGGKRQGIMSISTVGRNQGHICK